MQDPPANSATFDNLRAMDGQALEPSPYLSALADRLRSEVSGGWSLLAAEPADDAGAKVRHELLKTSYRLDKKSHGELFALAEKARAALGLEALPLSLYQVEGSGEELNAFLVFLPGELHIGLQGRITERLSGPDEMLAALAHEIAHHLLFTRREGEHWITRRLLEALVAVPGAPNAHFESWRLASLYTEIFCDRAALTVVGEAAPVVAALVKVATGATTVDGGRYLEQAAEICVVETGDAGNRGSTQVTHPETFLRAHALALFKARGADAEPEIARLIEGPPDLEKSCLVGRRRFADATRQLLAAFLAPPALRSDLLLGHARLFFPDLAPAKGHTSPLTVPLGELPALLAATREEGTRRYFVYLLLDLATADRGLDDAPLAVASVLAERLGLLDTFSTLAQRELGRTRRQLGKLGEKCESLLQSLEKSRGSALP